VRFGLKVCIHRCHNAENSSDVVTAISVRGISLSGPTGGRSEHLLIPLLFRKYVLGVYDTGLTISDEKFTSESCDESELCFSDTKKGKAVPLHAMEALGGRGGIAPTHSRPRH
jgi:hypothetical protein